MLFWGFLPDYIIQVGLDSPSASCGLATYDKYIVCCSISRIYLNTKYSFNPRAVKRTPLENFGGERIIVQLSSLLRPRIAIGEPGVQNLNICHLTLWTSFF